MMEVVYYRTNQNYAKAYKKKKIDEFNRYKYYF